MRCSPPRTPPAGNGAADHARIVVEVEGDIARRQFEGAPAAAIGREIHPRLGIGEGGVGGGLAAAFAGENPAAFHIPAVKALAAQSGDAALVDAVFEVTGLGQEIVIGDGAFQIPVPGVGDIGVGRRDTSLVLLSSTFSSGGLDNARRAAANSSAEVELPGRNTSVPARLTTQRQSVLATGE